MRGATAVRDVVRSHALTHIVYSNGEPGDVQDAIRAFAAQDATPVWRFGDYIVAVIKPD